MPDRMVPRSARLRRGVRSPARPDRAHGPDGSGVALREVLPRASDLDRARPGRSGRRREIDHALGERFP
jgi:hypothetical protein